MRLAEESSSRQSACPNRYKGVIGTEHDALVGVSPTGIDAVCVELARRLGQVEPKHAIGMRMDTTEVYVICAMNDIPSRRARGFQLLRVDAGTQRPWSIVVVRWGRQVFGYENKCPHDGVRLDWEPNQFFDPNGIRLMCGKHGAQFELGTGLCVDGPCKGQSLQPVALSVIDGDICITHVTLVEDDTDVSGSGAD